MWQLLTKGGWVTFPIVMGSVVALALFAERLWATRRERVNPQPFLKQLVTLLRKGQWSEARVLCQQDSSALSRVMWVALSQEEQHFSKSDLKEAVEEAGQREAFQLERGVGALGVIASLEPMMGLLGTVLGMITAFQKVEVGGVGDPRVVAAGVWAALVTTALGLMVAIPAYIAYRYLLSRVDRLALDLQGDVSMLLDVYIQRMTQNAQDTVQNPPQGNTPSGATGTTLPHAQPVQVQPVQQVQTQTAQPMQAHPTQGQVMPQPTAPVINPILQAASRGQPPVASGNPVAIGERLVTSYPPGQGNQAGMPPSDDEQR